MNTPLSKTESKTVDNMSKKPFLLRAKISNMVANIFSSEAKKQAKIEENMRLIQEKKEAIFEHVRTYGCLPKHLQGFFFKHIDECRGMVYDELNILLARKGMEIFLRAQQEEGFSFASLTEEEKGFVLFAQRYGSFDPQLQRIITDIQEYRVFEKDFEERTFFEPYWFACARCKPQLIEFLT